MKIRVQMVTLAAVLIGSTLKVQAQDLFGTLSWSDTPNQVHQKLVAMGYSGFRLVDRAACFVDSSCEGRFSGPSVNNGIARYSDGELFSVVLETGDPAGALSSLTQKYGQPKAAGQERSPGREVLRDSVRESKPTHLWERPGRVFITLYAEGRVSYVRDLTKSLDGSGMKNL